MNPSTYLQAPPKRRLLGLGVVVVLHILLFWALQAGLGQTVLAQLPNVVQAILLEERQPQAPTPATPPLVQPPPPKAPPTAPPPQQPSWVPPVEVPVAAAPTAQAITAVTSAPTAAAVQTAPSAPATPIPTPTPPVASKPSPAVRTAAAVSSVRCDKPDYPSASRRMEEEGTVSLRFLVAVDGQVLQSEIEKSSGFKRLDEAARAGLSKCLFRPATVDGKPEQAWASMKYTWRLE